MPSQSIRTVNRAASLASLANPQRARLIDTLRVDGPSTASSLAQRTGQAVGSISYHLKVLGGAGFIEEDPDLARDKRERWWRLAQAGLHWNRAEIEDSHAAKTALEVELLQTERQNDHLREWLTSSSNAGEWLASAYASQMWLRLTSAELGELADELQAVLCTWRERVEKDLDERRANNATKSVLVLTRAFPSQP